MIIMLKPADVTAPMKENVFFHFITMGSDLTNALSLRNRSFSSQSSDAQLGT